MDFTVTLVFQFNTELPKHFDVQYFLGYLDNLVIISKNFTLHLEVLVRIAAQLRRA